nr:tyrosine-type recombinase/integrase [Streptomyces somaliensis]
MSRSHFNDKWRAAVELAGLPEGTRFHDLKHFYTSRLGADGKYDPKTVQALSRHAEFSETRDAYAHPPVAVQGVKVDTFTGLFGAGGSSALQARYGTRRRVDGSGTASSTARPTTPMRDLAPTAPQVQDFSAQRGEPSWCEGESTRGTVCPPDSTPIRPRSRRAERTPL